MLRYKNLLEVVHVEYGFIGLGSEDEAALSVPGLDESCTVWGSIRLLESGENGSSLYVVKGDCS